MFVNVLAAKTEGSGGGFDYFTLILLAVFAIFIFMMFRRQKKSQQKVKSQQAQMAPGVDIMTSYGLYGTVVDIDESENKVVIELSPGNTATVHRQSVTKIITAPVETPMIPDDASELTYGAAHDGGKATAGETSEETLNRLNSDDRWNKDEKNNDQ